jgi:CheY-like chemotaxis protein
LGLSAVLGIIRAHKGAIEIDSAVGRGTTFRVYFPAETASVRVGGDGRPALCQLSGTGTILVVDDEEVVRRMARLALGRCGYQVLVAENGKEALQLLRGRRGRIDLVILDLTMPVIDGEAALPEIRRIDPVAKVILSSGFSEAEATERFRGQNLHGFLQKPYAAAMLAEQVRAVLRHQAASGTGEA